MDAIFLTFVAALFVSSCSAQPAPQEASMNAALRKAMANNNAAALAAQASADQVKGTIQAIDNAVVSTKAVVKVINAEKGEANTAVAHAQAFATQAVNSVNKTSEAIKAIEAAAAQANLAVTKINDAAHLVAVAYIHVNNQLSAALNGAF